MPKNKNQLRIVSRSALAKGSPASSAAHPTVSARWLLGAIGITILGAVVCAWASLCLLFWQGGWELLYHPSSTVTRTPASVGLPFDAVAFASTDTGQLRLQGWWIPAAPGARFTVLYLHGQNGNLANAVDALAQAHTAGANVFAFDYRGYGRSQFVRPSEAHWRQDAGWALEYLTATRHVDSHTIVLMGDELGANLALEVAAAHPELAGVVLDAPLARPMGAVFDDPRAHLVPADALLEDRYDLDAAAAAVRVPSLWLVPSSAEPGVVAAFDKVVAPRQMVRVNADRQFSGAVAQWLATLSG
jgi:uncharacterized protein